MLSFQECALNYSSERFSCRIQLLDLQKKDKHQQALRRLIKADRHVWFWRYNALKHWWKSKDIWGVEEKSRRHTISNTAKAPISHADITSIPTQCSKKPLRVLGRARWVPSLPSLQAAVHFPLLIPVPLLLIPHIPYLHVWFTRRADAREGGRAASEPMRWKPINLLGAICRRLQSRSLQVVNIFVQFSCTRKYDYSAITSRRCHFIPTVFFCF